MFEEEIRRALDYVARGISVRIVGGTGSGRSTVAQSIIADLEKTGTEVYSLAGARLLRESPLAGIGALGLDMRARLNGPLGVADALAQRLARRGSKAIVVDDIDFLDDESLAVVDMVQKRTQRPLVMTMRDSVPYSHNHRFAPDRWPEAQIRLSPIRYDQVNKLVAETLAAPPDVDSTAHILMKSAGNPRLVVRIAQSAVLSKLLVLSDGQWSMAGHTLWNEHLQSTVEALLHGLSSDELTALHTMSVVGTRRMDFLLPIVGSDVLDNLERHGLVAVMETVDNEICVAVNPPIVVDYFRDHHMLAARRVLANRIARAVDTPFQNSLGAAQLSPTVAGLISELRREAGAGSTVIARHFQEQLRVLEEMHYGLWESEPTMSNAAAFLKFYWGGPIDPIRIEEVFSLTDTTDADAAEYFFFTMTRALWAISSGNDVEYAVGMLAELGKAHPEWKAEADAFAVFLEASYERMPENLDETLEGLVSRHPESGVIPVVRGILEVYRFDGQAALLALESAEGLDLVSGIEPFVRGLALHVAGRSDEALAFSLSQRAAALRNLDQFGFIANSYVATLALTRRGFSMEGEHTMSSVFALGRPGFLANSLHDAMLRIAGLRAVTGSKFPSLGAQARKDVADVGPLPGVGKGVYDLVAQQYKDPREFDKKAVDLLEQQLGRGYVMEAVFAALFMLCLLPGCVILEKTRQLLAAHGVTSHDQLLAIASATVDGDYQLLGILLDQYEPDVDLHSVGMLLKGASNRRRLERDVSAAAAFQQMAERFEARFPIPGQHHLILDTGEDHAQPLSPRETEIAILAGSGSNAEIADRLGISTRTVENHISRALKKTGTNTRNALYEFVRGSQP